MTPGDCRTCRYAWGVTCARGDDAQRPAIMAWGDAHLLPDLVTRRQGAPACPAYEAGGAWADLGRWMVGEGPAVLGAQEGVEGVNGDGGVVGGGDGKEAACGGGGTARRGTT